MELTRNTVNEFIKYLKIIIGRQFTIKMHPSTQTIFVLRSSLLNYLQSALEFLISICEKIKNFFDRTTLRANYFQNKSDETD